MRGGSTHRAQDEPRLPARSPRTVLLLALALLMVTTGLAGCIGDDEAPEPAAAALPEVSLPAPTSTAWNQFGGPDHAAVAGDLGLSLDVIARTGILLDNASLSDHQGSSPVWLPTPHGLAMVVWGAGDLVESHSGGTGVCQLRVVSSLEPLRIMEGPELPCDVDEFAIGGYAATAYGYDPVTDTVLACTDAQGDRPVVRALEAATGDEVWGITPADAGALPSSLEDLVFGVDDPWTCATFSLDLEARLLIAPIFESGEAHLNRVVAVDLDDGSILWSTGIAAPNELSAGAGAGQGAGFWPTSAAVTDVGVVVQGHANSLNDGSGNSLVWLDRQGTPIGFERCCTGSTGRTSAIPGWSDRLATNGRLAATAMDARVLLVDPLSNEPTAYELPAYDGACIASWPGPSWWTDHLLVPQRDTLTNLDSDTGEVRWRLTNPAGWGPNDLLIRPPSDLYMLAGRTDPRSTELALFRIDLHEGTILHRIPILTEPGLPQGFDNSLCGPTNTLDFDAHLIPLEDGQLIVATDDGTLVVLAEPDPSRRPQLDVSDAYPPPGATVSVAIEPPGETVQRTLLSWGDGTTTSVEPGVADQHSYAEPGRYTIRATAVYPDNTTATAEQVVAVGGTPPRELNAIQTAFEPENQDLTFGILGLLVALAGGLIALGRRRRSRGILQRELEAIDRAIELAGDDPAQQEAVLQERRAHVKGLLVDGALDEAQFVVLERHIDELAQGLRIGLLEEELPFLPIGMARALQSMLSDGRISAWERDRFLDGLEAEQRLSSEEKDAVRGLIDAWFSRDAGQRA